MLSSSHSLPKLRTQCHTTQGMQGSHSLNTVGAKAPTYARTLSNDVICAEEALAEAEHRSSQAEHCQSQGPYQQPPLHLQPKHAKAC